VTVTLAVIDRSTRVKYHAELDAAMIESFVVERYWWRLMVRRYRMSSDRQGVRACVFYAMAAMKRGAS
jgi:hypothetical protein